EVARIREDAVALARGARIAEDKNDSVQGMDGEIRRTHLGISEKLGAQRIADNVVARILGEVGRLADLNLVIDLFDAIDIGGELSGLFLPFRARDDAGDEEAPVIDGGGEVPREVGIV